MEPPKFYVWWPGWLRHGRADALCKPHAGSKWSRLHISKWTSPPRPVTVQELVSAACFAGTALTSWGVLHHALAHQMKKPWHPHSHNTLRRCKIIITSLQSVITVLNKNMTSNELCVPLSKISMRTHKDPSHPFTPLIGCGGCPFVTAMNEMSIQSTLMSPTMVLYLLLLKCVYSA